MAKKTNSLAKNALQTKKKISKRRKDFLNRRPHRSFKLTRRRDYKRVWDIPGYWAFTNQVRQTLWTNKKIFIKFLVLFTIFYFLIFGLMTQQNYTMLDEAVDEVGGDALAGELTGIVKNVAVFAGIMSGAFSPNLTEFQQAYGSLLTIISWLVLVWILRKILASQNNIKLRDALYGAGSPLISTSIVALILIIQMIPIAIAVLAMVGAFTTTLLEEPLLAFLFWSVELLLVTISTYWISSTILALVIVTLPGMYPLSAIKVAGDLVVGRRLRILYRFAWLVFVVVGLWLLVIVPLVVLSRLPYLEALPIVPVAVLIMSGVTLIISSSYTYMLYRKLVSDESKPA